ncbi:hypothetical protein FOMPIDRAFT_74431 [Fomitopsis schrenkii]|uniref:F-box domain-containing protein n=1 Tax=Fomitopsis schrenkii TaxID=2126942 RepID=S8EKN1_FOMSC|nr:hypothetical protein FOMPIDRAFT_74431 [Fomitopsis schrenkii]
MELPPELLDQALAELKYIDLARCREVCHLFNAIITESAVLQYKLELAKAGQEDGSANTLSPAERLQLLRKHQAAWTSLEHSYEKVVPMVIGQTWELYGGVLAQGPDSSSLTFRQLPSELRGIEEKEWAISDLGFQIRDFGMDPAQDLLVAIQMPAAPTSVFNVHLRDMYTGAPHPAAPNPAVLTLQPVGHQVSYSISISGDYLGIYVLSANEINNEVIIWNWKTGVCKLRYVGRSLESFAFLSERHVLLGLARRPLDQRELQALGIAEEPQLVVVDFLASNGEVTRLEDADFVCAFHYPTMETRAVPLDISIRTDPAPNWTPHPNMQVPFYTARDDRLLVVTFTVYAPLEGHAQFLLFVRSATLLSHVAALKGEAKRRFRWDEWGPSQTRMMRAPRAHNSTWVCYVFGLRFVTTRKRQGKPKWIEVYDFRPHAGDRRAAAEAGPDEDEDEHSFEGGWVSAEMEMPEGVFGDTVATSLPYHMRTVIPPRSKGEKDWKHVMLSEDTIIVMGNDDDSTRRIRLLTF